MDTSLEGKKAVKLISQMSIYQTRVSSSFPEVHVPGEGESTYAISFPLILDNFKPKT